MWIQFDQTGQGLLQLEELTLAFVLSALVGLERELRQNSAGLRTYTLVGVSAALFMLISKYGFMDVLSNGRVVVDPSRVAAQLPRERRTASQLRICYQDGRGLLPTILIACTQAGLVSLLCTWLLVPGRPEMSAV